MNEPKPKRRIVPVLIEAHMPVVPTDAVVPVLQESKKMISAVKPMESAFKGGMHLEKVINKLVKIAKLEGGKELSDKEVDMIEVKLQKAEQEARAKCNAEYKKVETKLNNSSLPKDLVTMIKNNEKRRKKEMNSIFERVTNMAIEKIEQICDERDALIKVKSPRVSVKQVRRSKKSRAKARKSAGGSCPPNTIKNPKTNRCILNHTRNAKKILGIKKCKSDQILNPKTNRCVLKSGKVGKKLV